MGRGGLISLSILLVCSVGRPNDCVDTLVAFDRLTDEQHQALASARWTHKLSIVQGEVNGVPRLVVILGESHIQNKETIDSARQVVDAFPQRGIENLQKSPLWRLFNRLALASDGILEGRNGGSTITYARSNARLAQMAEKIVRRYRLDEKSAAELERFRYSFRGYQFSGKDILRLRAIAPDVKTFSLENGSSLTIPEHLTAWAVPGVRLGWKIAPLSGPLYLWQRSAWTEHDLMGAVILSLGLTAASLAADTMWAPDATDGMNAKRDAYMAQAVQNYFESNPEQRILLVVTGEGHVNGVTDELKGKGFAPKHYSLPPREEILPP